MAKRSAEEAGLDDDEARKAYLQSVVTAGFIHDRTDVDARRRPHAVEVSEWFGGRLAALVSRRALCSFAPCVSRAGGARDPHRSWSRGHGRYP